MPQDVGGDDIGAPQPPRGVITVVDTPPTTSAPVTDTNPPAHVED